MVLWAGFRLLSTLGGFTVDRRESGEEVCGASTWQKPGHRGSGNSQLWGGFGEEVAAGASFPSSDATYFCALKKNRVFEM